ncbi:hypothetical protein FQR65_LT03445 [Abscondita terminalis]|nr:hypothetical protein FQR65_LT03445 [Abscondita terminalis]
MKAMLLISLALVSLASCRPSVSHTPSNSYLPAHQLEEEKNVYFYASPDDGYFTKFQIHVIPTLQIDAPPSLVEDKTVLYVLNKKPEEEQTVSIPPNIDVRVAKPEVFFIKYGNKQEVESVVSKGIDGQQVGVNVPDLQNEQVFINSLDSATDVDSKTHTDGGITDTSNTSVESNKDSQNSVTDNSNTQRHTVIITEGEENIIN